MGKRRFEHTVRRRRSGKAQAIADGTLRKCPTLPRKKSGTPKNGFGPARSRICAAGVPAYSAESEAEYYRDAMARRTDILVEAASWRCAITRVTS